MPTTITRWADSTPPNPDVLLTRLRATGQRYTTWSNAPGDTYAPHSHSYDKHLVCLSGSIRFTLPATGAAMELSAGDELRLPAGTPHGAIVGVDGVQCAEAHLAAC